MEEIEALFSGFNKTFSALEGFKFSFFSRRGCLASLTECLRFFPSLWFVDLRLLNLDEWNLRGLLDSLRFIPNLMTQKPRRGNPLGEEDGVKSIVKQALPQVDVLCYD